MRFAVLLVSLPLLARAFTTPITIESTRLSSTTSIRLSAQKALETNRRNFLVSSASTAAAVVASVAVTQPASAASTARVAEWPNLAYLEPIYELKLSVDALSQGVKDTSRWPLIQKRLDKFFKGGLISEKNYYAGVSVEYMNQIKYDKEELKEYIKLDKNQRFNAFDACLKNLELLKNDIAANESPENVKTDAEAAQRALGEWFSRVPSSDVQAVGKLFVTVKSADTNRDGKLDDQELETLSDNDRAVWKKRVELFGNV